MKDGRHEWFAQVRYGYGAFLPIAWQGWAVLLVYLAIFAAAIATFQYRLDVLLAIMLPITIMVVVVVARTTRGGWRWRWGEEE